MRRPLAIPALLTLVLAVLLVVAAPASAKGATSVTVVGPGIPKLTVDHWTEPDEDVDLGRLSEVSGIYGIYGDGSLGDAPSLTKAELGPRYVLTWYEASKVMAVSHVYPFAVGGAWAEVPPGQRLWGEPLRSGWWHGGDALRDAIVALGATDSASGTDGDPTSDTQSTSDDVPAAAALPPDAGSSDSSWPTAGAVVALVGICVGAVVAFWLLRRRRTSPSVLTLSEPA
jgi:hypothetical protein